MKHLLAAFGLLFSLCARTQTTQVVRGIVVDQVLQTALAGATITISGTHQRTISDSNGYFRFPKVPVGSHQLQVSYVGYKIGTLNNLQVISGKELVVTIPLELSVQHETQVVVKGSNKKNKPLNDMSLVSARAFTVEETQNYAAAVNDPLRMATNFAGVVSADDGGNNIVIRGNAPNGLLWRMEGIDIPNPNHFANSGASGGGISILSAQLLANSDFLTGAFAAEYGNASSGVFDLKLRKGNNERREYTLQAGLLGLNAAAEGPFKKGSKSSYLVNYRYSTLQLLAQTGLNIGIGATDFQDYSYNIHLPTKKAGQFTLFGFGGFNKQDADAKKDPADWESEADRYGFRWKGNTLLKGATHQVHLGRRTLLKSALAWSQVKVATKTTYQQQNGSTDIHYNQTHDTKRWTLTSTLHHRISNAHQLRAGFIASQIDFNYYQQEKSNVAAPLVKVMDVKDNTQTIQAFAQWQARPSDKWTLNAGLHYLRLQLNGSQAIEPRASVRYQLSNTASLSVGYGLHSQVLPMGVYFGQQAGTPAGKLPNRELDFTRSHHYIVGYQQQLSSKWRSKVEVYYQQLQHIPVGNSDTSTLASINLQDGFVTDQLVNKGRGRNYGIELSLERHLDNHFYFMWSNSVYRSLYTPLDGKERSTRYDGRYASNLIAGKDFVQKQGRRTFDINFKLVYAGGFRHTPINEAQSKAKGYTVYFEERAFEMQLPAYFRSDIRISMTWNKDRRTNTLSLDIQNVTNRQNVFGYYYDQTKQKVVTGYQAGIITVINYKLEF